MLERLNKVNDTKIYSVFDNEFKPYGKVIESFDFSSLIKIAQEKTEIPESGNFYTPSFSEFEMENCFLQIQNRFYGEMPIQIGYCNGKNSTYNGFEYHKGAEINIAVTDFMLVLGHIWQIENNCFAVGNERVFFVPKNEAIEIYQTTLHLSPCKTCDEGYKDIVILPKGTNTPLESKETNLQGENRLLLMKNKWILCHPEREPLMKQGAFPGLIGENKELKY
ncbi:MAG: DUF4867 family protein [Acutalibacteraceae bacterium]